MVDKDRIKGSAKQVKGSVREPIGKNTGDRKAQAEGAAEKTVGKVQSGVGKAVSSRPGQATPVPQPPDQPDIAPPAEPVRKPPQYARPRPNQGC